jgi:hypothetical protein
MEKLNQETIIPFIDTIEGGYQSFDNKDILKNNLESRMYNNGDDDSINTEEYDSDMSYPSLLPVLNSLGEDVDEDGDEPNNDEDGTSDTPNLYTESLFYNLTHTSNRSNKPSAPPEEENNTIINHPLLNEYEMNKSYLDKIITDALEEKNTKIIDVNIESLPEIFSSMIGIETLTIIKCNLKNLKNLPPNLKKLIINDNDIENLDGNDLPDTLTELTVQNNTLRTIINLKPGLIKLTLSKNKINSLDKTIFPSSLQIFICRENLLEKLPNFNNGIIEICLIENLIDNIDNIPDSCEILDICRNNIKIIYKLPLALKIFKAYRCKIDQITCLLPNSITELDLYQNNLKSIPNIPTSLLKTDLASNLLESIPNFPECTKEIDIQNNPNLKLTDSQITYFKTKIQEKCDIKYDINLSPVQTDSDIFDYVHPNDMIPIPIATELAARNNQDHKPIFTGSNITAPATFGSGLQHNSDISRYQYSWRNKYSLSNPNYIPHKYSIPI